MAALLCLSCLRKEEEEVTELDYRHCSLDDVPNEIFAYERTLETLRLDSNNIRDLPRPLFHCHGLKELNLADNELGSIPSAVSSLALLTSLDVSKNVLTDLPETIKQCKHLAVIQASVNPLQKIPEGCTQLISLTQLCLNDCLLEYIPANFGRLARLRVLELRENSLTSLPRSMERLTSLTRIDLSQNQFTEIPEVLNTMFELEELLLDGNKLKSLPSFFGHFSKLKHLEASFNQLENICDELGNCVSLVDLTLSSNDLKHVPESLESLTRLVTLKLDDNQLEKLPENLGKMTSLEELYVAENFLTYLPPSIGWLRRLHTLNVDENDLEDLPPEIGSCRHMKIFSVHGNKLSGLPDEVGHLSQLAVLNLAGNYIPHLPVSFVKLKSITAIWLANNQTKPLVQLNTDLDPVTGLKVLTNFLLPQQPDPDRNGDNNSDSGSFHASVWEEERSKRSLVKWAGDESLDLDKIGNLRRAPTPFPKEMRAMAKKVANMKERKVAEEERNNKRRNTRETVRGRAGAANKIRTREADEADQSGVTTGDPKSQRGTEASDKVSRDSGVISPSHTEDTEEDTGREEDSDNTGAPLQVHDTPTLVHNNNNYLAPVKAELVTNELDEEESEILGGPRKQLQQQQMPPPYHIAATKSKQAGNFVNIHHRDNTSQQQSQEEHFYENQETVKRAGAVNGHHARPLERKSSFLSDGTFESISESETSTAPSSLQTIIRAPYALSLADPGHLSQDSPLIGQHHQPPQPLIGQRQPPGRSSESESEAALTSANALRKVSEQLLNTSRTRNSISRPGSVALSTPQISRLPLASSRPSSQQGNMTPVTSRSAQAQAHLSRSAQLPSNSHTGREMRPNSFAGPPNTVGLPVSSTPGLLTSQEHGHVASKYSAGGSKLPKLSQQSIPESNGLLSTISQAAISDDESPPATHKPQPPKFNTAVLSRPSPPLEPGLPNYENVGHGTVTSQHNGVTSHQMTQGQFRAAASHAKVATIPDDSRLSDDTSVMTPHSNVTSPHNNVMTPQNNGMTPQNNGMISQNNGMNPHNNVMTSHNNGMIPHNNTTYMPMGLRKASSSIPLATSSPSGIPRYTSSVK